MTRKFFTVLSFILSYFPSFRDAKWSSVLRVDRTSWYVSSSVFPFGRTSTPDVAFKARRTLRFSMLHRAMHTQVVSTVDERCWWNFALVSSLQSSTLALGAARRRIIDRGYFDPRYHAGMFVSSRLASPPLAEYLWIICCVERESGKERERKRKGGKVERTEGREEGKRRRLLCTW